mgnify:CR=1 FL=1
MKLDGLVGGLVGSGDPGAFIKQELEEGISPITKRIDALEKKIDTAIVLMQSIDRTLTKLQPVIDTITKLPFFRR